VKQSHLARNKHTREAEQLNQQRGWEKKWRFGTQASFHSSKRLNRLALEWVYRAKKKGREKKVKCDGGEIYIHERRSANGTIGFFSLHIRGAMMRKLNSGNQAKREEKCGLTRLESTRQLPGMRRNQEGKRKNIWCEQLAHKQKVRNYISNFTRALLKWLSGFRKTRVRTTDYRGKRKLLESELWF
jgi:hypothetical protein